MTDETAFVGREREFADLLSLADRAGSGHGEFALIGGEPGVGKSALAERVLGVCASRDIATHWGGSVEGDEQPPFWTWIQVLRGLLASVPPDDMASALGPAYRELGLLVPEHVAPPPRADRGPADTQAQFLLYDAITRAVGHASQLRPRLIVLDDLHLADRSSLRCLAFLVRQLRDSRVLVVGTHRDVDVDPDSPWAAAAGELARTARTVELSGLSLSEIAELLERTLPGVPTGRIAAEVQRDSAGNPLFARQVARLIATEGQVTRVPATIREVMTRRLARFAEPTRAVLRAAAVMGATADVRDLAMVCDLSAQEVLDALAGPVAARIVEIDAEDPSRLSFAHGLMRQVLLEELPAWLRPRLHLRAATALESLRLADPGPYLARLAGHYLEAAALGDVEPAIRYSRAAAVQASEAYAYEDSLRHLTNVRRLLEHDVRTPPERLARALLDVADAQVHAGCVQAAERTYRDALRLADRAGAARLYARAALGCCVNGTTGYHLRPDLIELLQSALDRLGDQDHGLRGALLAELAEVWAVFDDGYEQALATATSAVDVARSSGEDLALSRALLAELHVVWAPNGLSQRRAIVAELDAIARRQGDEEMLIHARLNAFGHAIEAGDRPAADALLTQIVESAERLRTPRWTLRKLSSQTTMAVLEADYAHCLELVEEVENLVRQAPTLEGELAVLHMKAQMITDVERPGDPDLAEGFLALAVEHGHSVWSVAALILALTGREADARHALRRGLEVVSNYRNRRALLTSAVRLAEAAVRLDDRSAALTLRDVLGAYGDRIAVVGDGMAVLGPVALALGRLAGYLGDPASAERHLAHADEVSHRMGARSWLVRTALARAQLGSAPTGLASGGARAATAILGQARARAAQLGLSRLLREAEAGLAGAGLATGPRPGDAPPTVRAVLARENGLWTVRYGETSARLRDSKGMNYLAELIRHPGVERHVLDLVTSLEGGDVAERHALGDAGPVLDAQAKATYKRRLAELRERLEDAREVGNDAAAERMAAEIDAIAGELARAVGLGGRDRRAAAVAEKARLNVTRAVRSTIGRIGEVVPPLGAHLTSAVHTGVFCVYQPGRASQVVWQPAGDGDRPAHRC